jgi:hypothetical protein
MNNWRKLTKGERKLVRVKKEQTEAIARRTTARVERCRKEHAASLLTDELQQAQLERQDRHGRGQIDRYGIESFNAARESSVAELTIPSGPEAGFPPPTPDPRCNPPLSRATTLKSETATWTGVIQEEGRLEWCRTNKTGNQEWLSAVEVEPRKWQITKSKTTSSSE